MVHRQTTVQEIEQINKRKNQPKFIAPHIYFYVLFMKGGECLQVFHVGDERTEGSGSFNLISGFTWL